MDSKGVIRLLCHLLLIVIGLTACTSVYPVFGGQLVLKGKCIESEKQALLEFKRGFVDKFNYLSSWGSEEDDCCLWRGVGCHNQTGNVIKLDLSDCDNLDGDSCFFECENLDGDYCFTGNVSDSLLQLRHLRYLDLSGYNFFESFPKFIGSLSNLRYLNLSYVNFPFKTVVPVEISNLSHLHTLDLSHGLSLQSSKLGWLSGAYSLRQLDLSQVDLSTATDWLHTVAKLPSLSTLSMGYSSLPPPMHLPLSHVNISKSLTHIDLSGSNFDNSHIYWLPNITRNAKFLGISNTELWGSIPQFIWAITSLLHLDLSDNGIEGRIPPQIAKLTSLQYINLYANNLEGKILTQLGNITSLIYLRLCSNNLQGEIPYQLGNITLLQHLDLSDNNLQGVVPQLGMLPNLRNLYLAKNNLTGVLPGFLQGSLLLQELSLDNNRFESTSSFMESIGQLSTLPNLDISSNPFSSGIVEAHLNNLSALQVFHMSNLPLNISLDWVPPFQLQFLKIDSCNMSPHFPQWLQTQNNMTYLDLSHNGILGTIPDWIWNIFSTSPSRFLDLSHNHLSGTLSNIWPSNPSTFPEVIDLSSNNLSGPIPPNFLNYMKRLDLSNNNFLGTISVLCAKLSEDVFLLDLSNNSLSGELPDCWTPWKSLEYLNLADNNFSGNIPESMGSLPSVLELHLRNNKLDGELPSSLRNCTKLEVLDVMENNLSGNIPVWIGENLLRLVVLSLRSNMLHGNIPPAICNLQDIQILDLSLNNLSGNIPWCFDNFTRISSSSELEPIFRPIDRNELLWADIGIFTSIQVDSELVDLKGIEREYKNSNGLINLIDLSGNKLSGTIPHQVTSLVYLVSLNLSRNYLIGAIPSTIGNLRSLETLDLSRNQLLGEIPSSLSSLSFLDTLNLSYNNLSGRIPLSTQLQRVDPSAYGGNSRLCGPPLPACREDGGESDFRPDNHSDDQHTDNDELLSLPFYVGAILGFIVGFWGVFGSLVMKRSWRIAYFRWLSRVNDNVYVKIVVGVGRLKRRFQR